MSSTIVVDQARRAIADLPYATSYGEPPMPQYVYLPRSHLKAMHPDALLVTGMRGAGKTFWWGALQNRSVRRLLVGHPDRFPMSEDTEVRTGFGVTPAPDKYPGKDTLQGLFVKNVEPRTVWRTVQAWQLAPEGHPLRRKKTWLTRTTYVHNNPERIDRLFQERDKEFEKEGVHCMFLFDALDRCADDWKEMYRIIRGLLQTALDMRSYRKLRVKVFLRTDQMEESNIADFPDASKVLSSEVELHWPRRELYGLLWHYLINGQSGRLFRSFFGGGHWPSVRVGRRAVYSVPRSVVNEDHQREKFHALAGPWMGRGPKRGFPYTWIPNHLGDTEGRVSPRSFITALKKASEDTIDEHVSHKFALHYDSIKRGVQEASKIRVSELQEDYPWVDRILSPLSGKVVPCEFEEIEQCWYDAEIMDQLTDEWLDDDVKLPPRHIYEGPEGVRADLESLGVFLRLRDERVNIPDVFRVGYGVGRRGGVRPIR